MSSSHSDRLERAKDSLTGLSVGDALGGFFEFSHGNLSVRIRERKLPQVTWHWTDDTHMALSIFSILRQYGTLEQDAFAHSLAHHYERSRGYGMATRAMLQHIRKGEDWRAYARKVFRGEGSCGNGSASRMPPLGAFFADDIERIVTEAERAAVVTHAHPEAVAGAIAVAVATAWAWQFQNIPTPERHVFLDKVVTWVPPSTVREKIEQARALAPGTTVGDAVELLGNGNPATAQMTVPFALWCAGECLDNYEDALWLALEGQGDCDTIGAIVGGIVAMRIGCTSIPPDWLEKVEPLPKWVFEEKSGDK